jgi:hypothetical protein
LSLARWLTVSLGVIGTATAVIMARWNIASLWDLFLQLLGIIGGSMAGLFTLGIFSRRANGRGAIVGAIVSVFVIYLLQAYTHVHFFLYAGIGILSCFCAGYLASLVFPTRRKDLTGLTIYDLSTGAPRVPVPQEVCS